MASLEELAQSLKAQNVNLDELVAPKQQEKVQQTLDAATTPGEPSDADKPSIVQSLKDSAANLGKTLINDPKTAIMAGVRGVEKSFEIPAQIPIPFTGGKSIPTGVPENLIEHLEGTMAFPIIRGAELAARAFVDGDAPELTSFRKLVEDQVVLTKALQDRGSGLEQGFETSMALVSAGQLLKSGVKAVGKFGPKAMLAIKEYQAGKAATKATNLGQKLLQLDHGPVLDAVIDRPDEVAKLIAQDGAYVDDLAVEMSKKLNDIHSSLGKKVGEFRKNFSSDPTVKVNVSAPVTMADGTQMAPPLELITNFENSVTSTQGVSVLEGKQQGRLDKLKSLMKPGDEGHIASKDAMLALDKIDEMTNIKEVENGNISAAAVNNLLQVRRSLKAQIRGNNEAWAMADDIFSKYTDDAANLAERFSKDSRESFVDNLFGINKNPIRDRIARTLDYADYVDTAVTGSSDAFFRRLANIKGANVIQDVKVGLKDKSADNVNRIVQFWVKTGQNTGSAMGSAGLGTLGSLLNVAGAVVGSTSGAAAGKVVGGVAGLRMGLRMADPQRVLNAAVKAKELSSQARQLASDLQTIHKTYGNDGVISMMDVLGSIPAMNEFIKFTNGQKPSEKRQDIKSVK